MMETIDYVSMLDDAENEIVELRRQLEAAQRWEPVEDGWLYHTDETASLSVTRGGATLVVTDHVMGSVTRHHLPDDVRLCRKVENQPATGEGE